MNKISVIRREGGSRVMAVTKIIPEAWTVVNPTVIKSTKNIIIIEIERVR